MMILVFSYLLSLFIPLFFFLPQFTLGYVLAKNHQGLLSFLRNLNKSILVILFIFILFLYGNRFIIPQIAYWSDNTSVYLSGLGSFGLILICSRINFVKTLLSSKVGVFLGETSFSFYLLHLPILMFVCSKFYPLCNSILICGLITLTITYTLSYVVYLHIEKRMITIGSVFSKKIQA